MYLPNSSAADFARTAAADQADFELQFDLQDGFFGKQADDQLVDRRFAELGPLGEFAARNAFSSNVAAYRLDDTLAVCVRDRHGAPIEPLLACGTTIMAGAAVVCYPTGEGDVR